jgi:hypothetical protein
MLSRRALVRAAALAGGGLAIEAVIPAFAATVTGPVQKGGVINAFVSIRKMEP